MAKAKQYRHKRVGFVTQQLIYMPAVHQLVETWGYFKNLTELGELFPGLWLAQDTRTKEYFLVGGQGKPGDDILRFKPKELVFDPYNPYSNKEINAFPNSHPIVKQYSRYLQKLGQFEAKLRWDLDRSIAFYESCRQAGYRRRKDGRIGAWVIDRIEDFLKAPGRKA